MESIPPEHRAGFMELHETIIAAAPEAESCISYSMPAIKQQGIVVYYACWAKHMAVYPMPSALCAFSERLEAWVTSKSTVQFPHGAPLPKELIEDIVKFRVRENLEKSEARRMGRAGSL